MEPSIDAEPMPSRVIHDSRFRLLWFETSDALQVFANGEQIAASLSLRGLVESLCAGERVATATLSYEENAFLELLWRSGVLEQPENLQ